LRQLVENRGAIGTFSVGDTLTLTVYNYVNITANVPVTTGRTTSYSEQKVISKATQLIKVVDGK
jgi:hypothetical protein